MVPGACSLDESVLATSFSSVRPRARSGYMRLRHGRRRGLSAREVDTPGRAGIFDVGRSRPIFGGRALSVALERSVNPYATIDSSSIRGNTPFVASTDAQVAARGLRFSSRARVCRRGQSASKAPYRCRTRRHLPSCSSSEAVDAVDRPCRPVTVDPPASTPVSSSAR